MHYEVSETENIRYNLGIEKMIVEGCECLLDANQVFIREGKTLFSLNWLHYPAAEEDNFYEKKK